MFRTPNEGAELKENEDMAEYGSKKGSSRLGPPRIFNRPQKEQADQIPEPNLQDTEHKVSEPKPFAGLLQEARVREQSGSPIPSKPSVGKVANTAQSLKRTSQASRSSASRDGAIPQRIGGFEILGRIGSGGMARVYRGHQTSLQRPVAIKSLRREYFHDAEVINRFELEATSLARLQHENIVQVVDLIATRDGGRHIVMELIEGIDCFDLLEKLGTFPVEAVALIAHQLASALEHAHRCGLVHRDIKPSNVFISKSGTVKLMDFGIARASAQAAITQVGFSLGTPAYMAPEQIRGEDLDGRADIFSVGVFMYELLTGEPPWPGPDARVALDVLRKPYPPLSTKRADVAVELQSIVKKCLQKDANNRWSSAQALRIALEAWTQKPHPTPYILQFLEENGLEVSPGTQPRQKVYEDTSVSILRPIAVAHMLGFLLITAAMVMSVSAPMGLALPETRPKIQVSTSP